MKRLWLAAAIPFVAMAYLLGGIAFAQYSSNNYKVNEVLFGSGGDNNQSSASYRASVAAGVLGVGRYSSQNYQAYSGFLTPNEPFLEVFINSSTVDLGVLDPSSTKTGTAVFHVRAYTDSGYTVQTMSDPPSYISGSRSHTLTNMSAQDDATPGVEQFGINLTGPNNVGAGDFGAAPSPQPNSSFATGVAATGYNTVNKYKYIKGNVIAQTPAGSSGWGQTNYTISYIANISILTPAGSYKMVHDLVVVATY